MSGELSVVSCFRGATGSVAPGRASGSPHTNNQAPSAAFTACGADLGGIVPDAHDAFEAYGAHTDPDDDAGDEASQLCLASPDERLLNPAGLIIGIAQVDLGLVAAGAALGFEAHRDDAAQLAMEKAQVLRGGG